MWLCVCVCVCACMCGFFPFSLINLLPLLPHPAEAGWQRLSPPAAAAAADEAAHRQLASPSASLESSSPSNETPLTAGISKGDGKKATTPSIIC